MKPRKGQKVIQVRLLTSHGFQKIEPTQVGVVERVVGNIVHFKRVKSDLSWLPSGVQDSFILFSGSNKYFVCD